MSEIILNRYYSKNFNTKNTNIKEAINEVFINLHKYNPNRSKAYSFCSLIIKQKLYTLIVSPTLRINKIPLELHDDFENLPISIEDVQEQLYDKDAILKLIETVRIKVNKGMAQQKIDRHHRGYPLIPHPKGMSLLFMLDKCWDYVNKYEDFSGLNLAEYLYYNTDLSRGTIGLYLLELFGCAAYPNSQDGIKDNSNKAVSISIVQDDKCPNEKYISGKKISRLKKYGDEYNYF